MNQQIVLRFSFVCTILLCANWFSVQSQETTYAPQPKHEIKVFEDKENNHIYWPIDMPVFIRLSNSPQDNAPSFLLEALDNQGKDQKRENEGIRLEMQGNQFVRWINAISREEIQYRFFCDAEPPKVSHTYKVANRHTRSDKLFFGKELNLELQATDDFSGVEVIFYSLDGSAFIPYTQPISLNTEKNNNIRYYAVDRVGYASELVTLVFQTDHTPPVSKHTTENNFIDEILSDATTIKLEAVDELSGVKRIFYSFNNTENFSTYRSPLSISALQHGTNTLYYYAEDHVGNKEEIRSFGFYLDKEPPLVSVSIRGENHTGASNTYIASHSLLELSAIDDKAGLRDIFYSINNNRNFVKYENPFPVSLQSGPFSIFYYSFDNLGNRSTTERKNFQMDLTPPQTAHKISGAAYTQRSTIWINSDSKIELSASDAASGLKNIHYVIGDGPENQYNGNPISIDTEGNYLLRYFSYDNVNNREGDNVFLLIVDNSPPNIQEIFSVSPSGQRNDEDGSEKNVYPQFTTLFIAATDMSSGLKDITYSLNNGRWENYQSQILCRDEGRYHIRIKATDNLGHLAESEVIFFVEALR